MKSSKIKKLQKVLFDSILKNNLLKAQLTRYQSKISQLENRLLRLDKKNSEELEIVALAEDILE